MVRGLAIAVSILLLTNTSLPLAAEAQPEVPAHVRSIIKSLKPKSGKVSIPDAKATLDLGESYDFYGPEDAKQILVSIWGNPPQSADNALGLVMPKHASPISDTWGAVVTFENTGYVSDEDASEFDYDALANQIQNAEPEVNARRQQAGYPAIHLVWWAEQPHYDSTSHSVVWAREIEFSGDKVHTLNYDVRTLGRNGVLSLNLISNMLHLADVRTAGRKFVQHATFEPGSRYQDYDSSKDRKAEYGVGGLIAAGVGVAAAKKLGLLALLVKFIKPIIIAVIAGLAVLRNRIARLFGRDADTPAD